jgi:hypothetical protein
MNSGVWNANGLDPTTIDLLYDSPMEDTYIKDNITLAAALYYSNQAYTDIQPISLSIPNTTLWDDTRWNSLSSVLTTYINDLTSCTTIDDLVSQLASDNTSVRDALFNEDIERRQQSLKDWYNSSNSKTSVKGFTYPNSMVTGLKLEGQQKVQKEMSAKSKEVMKFVQEFATAQHAFIFDNAISQNGADVDWNSNVTSLLLKAYETKVNTLITMYKTECDAIFSTSKVLIKEFDSLSKFSIKQYNEFSNEDLTRTSALAEARIKAFEANHSDKNRAYEAFSDSQYKYVSSMIENVRTKLQTLEASDATQLKFLAEQVRQIVSFGQSVVTLETNTLQEHVKAASTAAQGVAQLINQYSSSYISLQQIASA